MARDRTDEPAPPPDEWQAECERLAAHAADLLRLAGRHRAAAAVVEVVLSAPRVPGCGPDPNSLFTRLLNEARARVDDAAWEEAGLARVIAYFDRLAAACPYRRAMLESSVVGAVVGLAMGG